MLDLFHSGEEYSFLVKIKNLRTCIRGQCKILTGNFKLSAGYNYLNYFHSC